MKTLFFPYHVTSGLSVLFPLIHLHLIVVRITIMMMIIIITIIRADTYMFRARLFQETILTSRLDLPDRVHELKNLSRKIHIIKFHQNPLQAGFYLESITTGKLHNMYVYGQNCVSPCNIDKKFELIQRNPFLEN